MCACAAISADLDLSGANFAGPMPSFTNTTALETIDITGNAFYGSIPDR